MKKIGFALQVFGLLGMFLLYAILEINHATGKTVSGSSTSNVSIVEEAANAKTPANGFVGRVIKAVRYSIN